MNEQEEAAHGPYTKLIGPEILAKDYSNHPLDRRLYGRWRCRGGREVLFNRDYQPLWSRRPGQPVEVADPKEWVEGIIGDADYFWTDGRGTNALGLRLLREWKIAELALAKIEENAGRERKP